MRLSALIFDMDGTMIDSMPTHRRTWAEFARSQGLEVDIDDLMRRTTGRNGVECMRELFQADIPEAHALAFIEEKEALYRSLFGPQFAEVAGFSAFAEQARAMGLAIGVGTAGDRHNVDFAFSHLRMAHAPSVIVRGDEGLPGKPEPAIFLEAARRLGVSPAQCVVFEDAPLGIEAARRAGMQAVGIGTSHSARELAGPHVLAYAPDFSALIESKFLEKTYVATA
ncbi:HAD family hydrolase [Rhodoferax aquaticus]|uniref:HAD family phosphatase n=1 Tax=Rhodoferax aquaticus TaxID=2527691 RepID=A0A515EMI5_9BURK|nr:HAD family phosphatase [Rhodoferax aquaticus]QDL53854.1 HAD family phosphatase [Rhodoferax aquaticus]